MHILRRRKKSLHLIIQTQQLIIFWCFSFLSLFLAIVVIPLSIFKNLSQLSYITLPVSLTVLPSSESLLWCTPVFHCRLFREHCKCSPCSLSWDLTLSVCLQIQYFLQRRPSMKTLFVDSYSEMLLYVTFWLSCLSSTQHLLAPS